MKNPHFTFSILSLAFTLAGCDNATSTNKPAVAKDTDVKYPKTQTFESKLPSNAPVIKVATTGTMPPFSQKDNYGNMEGYDIDVIRQIGEHQGFKVQFYQENWQNLFNSVATGKNDLAISGISYKPERAQTYALSKSYFFNPSAIMYKKPNLSIKKFDDLKGLRVGAMEGTIQYDKLKETNQYAAVVPAKTTYLLFQALVRDEVDAILQDYPLLKDTAIRHPEQKVTIVPYQTYSDPTAQQVILLAKNNQELLNKINAGIDAIQADGTLKKINDKWKITVEDSAITSTTASSSTQ